MDTQLHPAMDGVQDEDPTTINYENLEEIYIKEEPLDTTSQDFEFYEFILQSIKTEECMEEEIEIEIDDETEEEIDEETDEEIDVVSVDEDQLTIDLNCTVLPTNPSIRGRQKLQRTVTSAMSNKREFSVLTTEGIKTRLRLRPSNISSNNTSGPGTKKREGGGGVRRGVKLGRYRYSKVGGSPTMWRSCHRNDIETKCNELRNLHNDSERQRREELRNAFNDLRLLVPEVRYKERAAKVMILREATSFCNRVSAENMQYQKHVAELRRQQERLRARVSHLRRLLAATR